MNSLFSPIKVGNMDLSNRIVMPPLASSKSTSDGFVTDELIDYYEKRAKSGLGLIIIEHAYILEEGKASDNQLGINSDECIEGLSKLCDMIHSYGVACALQINHSGSLAKKEVTKKTPVGPYKILHPNGKELPEELSISDIESIIEGFKNAAKRAYDAGFDIVEIHGAHGYLLSQFLSPITNKRTDNYGGSLGNRMRLHIDIIKAVKKVCPKDYPIAIRLGCDDLMYGGLDLAQSVEVAKALQGEGIALLDVSGGIMGSARDIFNTEGYFSYITEELKKHINIPIILTGGIKTPKTANQLIAEDKTDMVGIGREIIKNPNWAQDAREELKNSF